MHGFDFEGCIEERIHIGNGPMALRLLPSSNANIHASGIAQKLVRDTLLTSSDSSQFFHALPVNPVGLAFRHGCNRDI